MSIDGILAQLIAQGRLIEYVPSYRDPDFLRKRRVYMSQEAHQQCPPNGPSSLRTFRGTVFHNARAALYAFITGDEVEEGIHLKLLAPSEKQVWELRVLERPQSRLFGWFVGPDRLIVTHCQARDSLGAFDNPAWQKTIDKCVEKRIRMFPELPVFVGGRFTDYITHGGVVADD